LTVLGQLLTNNFPNSQTSSKCNTRQSKTANKLLTSSADSSNRAASGKLTKPSNIPTDPGMAMARFSIFFKLLFLGKTANPNPNPEVQFLHNATSICLTPYRVEVPGM